MNKIIALIRIAHMLLNKNSYYIYKRNLRRLKSKEGEKMPRATKEKSKKTNKKANKNKKINEVQNTKDNNKFSFDDEIVIGLRQINPEPINNEKNKNKKTNSKKSEKTSGKKIKKTYSDNKRNSKKKKKKTQDEYYRMDNINQEDINQENIVRGKTQKNYNEPKKQNKKLTKKQELQRKRRKFVFRIVKWLMLLGIIIGGIIFALLSPIFNIKEISVSGNAQISSQTIISLSSLTIDQNIFNFRTSEIVDNIKENAYIDSVKVSRKFPDTVDIEVEERVTTFMLVYGNAYVYINNQGYILEITSEKGDHPILTGFKTPTNQLVAGNRLTEEDLEKLNDVLKIMEATSSGESKIENLITEINISDSSNYILTLSKEKKQVYLGDVTDLSTKILWLNQFIEREKKNEGIIYLNMNLNEDMPYFRESV